MELKIATLTLRPSKWNKNPFEFLNEKNENMNVLYQLGDLIFNDKDTTKTGELVNKHIFGDNPFENIISKLEKEVTRKSNQLETLQNWDKVSFPEILELFSKDPIISKS